MVKIISTIWFDFLFLYYILFVFIFLYKYIINVISGNLMFQFAKILENWLSRMTCSPITLHNQHSTVFSCLIIWQSIWKYFILHINRSTMIIFHDSCWLKGLQMAGMCSYVIRVILRKFVYILLIRKTIIISTFCKFLSLYMYTLNNRNYKSVCLIDDFCPHCTLIFYSIKINGIG